MVKRPAQAGPHGTFVFSGFPALLIGLIATIVPLAYASPVDPTWVAGIYDAADYDDVIELLTNTDSAGHLSPPLAVRLSAIVGEGIVEPWPAAPSNAAGVFAFRLFRSPPAAMVKVVLRR